VRTEQSQSPLVHYLRQPSATSVGDLLAEAITFHSPVTDYHGRADVAHLFAAIANVLRDVKVERALLTSGGVTTFLTARVEQEAISGVLDERVDAIGEVVEATLLLRPYSALRIAIGHMQTLLSNDPLPSAR